ncbi:pre-mRNA-splicing factor cwc25 [Colletotrichum higginsianum]|nr:pre-mRNA-splicing factor cwc25 [Colletotrichum higginsianum]
MGGDLNLKKSFHPSLIKNQAKVWEEERKALEERKKTQQRINELKEEREREELQKKLEAAGHTKRVDRVEFLYSGPTDGQTGTTEERESYLLGKRRIDNLLKGTEHKNLEKQAGQESFMALQAANTARDTAAKVREDPLLAIKRQEQAAYEAMMNDPIKRRQLLASMGIADDKSKTEMRSTREGIIIDTAMATTTKKGTDGGGVRAGGETLKTRTAMRDDDAAIQRTGTAIDVDGRRDRDRHADAIMATRTTTAGNTAATAVGTANEEGLDRFPMKVVPPDEEKGHLKRATSGMTEPGMHRGTEAAETTTIGGKTGTDDSTAVPTVTKNRTTELRMRKGHLAAMQSAASDLDTDRVRRLAALAEREKAAREADDQARERSSKYGDREFVNGLHRKAGNMSLGERMGRGRQGLQKDDD